MFPDGKAPVCLCRQPILGTIRGCAAVPARRGDLDVLLLLSDTNLATFLYFDVQACRFRKLSEHPLGPPPNHYRPEWRDFRNIIAVDTKSSCLAVSPTKSTFTSPEETPSPHHHHQMRKANQTITLSANITIIHFHNMNSSTSPPLTVIARHRPAVGSAHSTAALR